MCVGGGREKRAGGEQRGSRDGAGYFAEIALKAAASPGFVLIAQTHSGVLLKAPALAGNASVPNSHNKILGHLLLHGGILQSFRIKATLSFPALVQHQKYPFASHHVSPFLWQYLIHTLSGHQLHYLL